ncbi:hypothetical protein KDH_66390 [Dictyobacter sp. S3.2.2.5]|uniref:site-specific DNA-methyltransferase (adenine-specific) n=1 Tax=Dictyobacter halimunensis TaxID=3026934 RepID=A0ABQ6G1P5_9CHLR|nr:hypothetical protein KDH_66390 [Dictyobacter sp. S3.2.2.5]
MAEVRPILDEIWERLRRANVGNDLAIIEYIATLLIADITWPFDVERPQKPKVRYNPDDEWLTSRLRFAAQQMSSQSIEEGIAELFNTHVLFYTSRSREEGSYPTPRHIVEFMINLLQIKPQHSFADFACGSGGFLIQRYQDKRSNQGRSTRRSNTQKGKTVGVEISPNWARIALANLLLHQVAATHVKIHIGDSVRLCGPGGELERDTFDRIAISPPLDVSIEVSQFQELLQEMRRAKSQGRKGEFSLDSDNIFTYLLQRKLSAQGKGALIVSTSTVTRASSKSQFVRRSLIEDREVQAVIQLNADALNPFTEETAYILLINKQPRDTVWFFQAQKDGYEPGMKRDLTQSPDYGPAFNDFPLIETAAQMTGREDILQHIDNPAQPISYHFVHANDEYVGCIIKSQRNTGIRIIQYEKIGSQPTLHIMISENQSLHIPLPHSNWPPPRTQMIFQQGDPDQMIAITPDGRCIGITVPISEISAHNDNLLPENYFQQYIPDNKDDRFSSSFPLAQPESVITDEGESDAPPPSQSEQDQPFEIPQIVNITEPTWSFGNVQHTVWAAIKLRFSTENYAAPFTSTQLIDALENNVAVPEIFSSLTLFERLGLIIRVNILPDQNTVPKTYYRRITARDIEHAWEQKDSKIVFPTD